MRGLEKTNMKRGQTDKQIYILTSQLYESIGPEGRCFEKVEVSKYTETGGGDGDVRTEADFLLGWLTFYFLLSFTEGVFVVTSCLTCQYSCQYRCQYSCQFSCQYSFQYSCQYRCQYSCQYRCQYSC